MPCGFGLRAEVRKRRPAGKPSQRTWHPGDRTGTCQAKYGLVRDTWNAEL